MPKERRPGKFSQGEKGGGESTLAIILANPEYTNRRITYSDSYVV